MKPARHALIALVLLVPLTGCMVFKDRTQPLLDTREIINEQVSKPKVYWSIKNDHDGAAASLHEGHFRRALIASKCCEIAASRQQADIIVEGVAAANYKPWMLLPGMISAGTVFIIPSWDTRRYDITIQVRPAQGRTWQYTLSEANTYVNWLPLIAVSILPPYWFYYDLAEPSALLNLYNNLFFQMKKDGALSGA